jgi:hypothetical protein
MGQLLLLLLWVVWLSTASKTGHLCVSAQAAAAVAAAAASLFAAA